MVTRWNVATKKNSDWKCSFQNAGPTPFSSQQKAVITQRKRFCDTNTKSTLWHATEKIKKRCRTQNDHLKYFVIFQRKASFESVSNQWLMTFWEYLYSQPLYQLSWRRMFRRKQTNNWKFCAVSAVETAIRALALNMTSTPHITRSVVNQSTFARF